MSGAREGLAFEVYWAPCAVPLPISVPSSPSALSTLPSLLPLLPLLRPCLRTSAKASFAGTTFILSMYNAGTRSIAHPNVVLGMALGYGGLVQLIAGVQEWACGNVSRARAGGMRGWGGADGRLLALLLSLLMVVSGLLSLRSTFLNSRWSVSWPVD